MKKSLVIFTLCSIVSACAAPSSRAVAAVSLLSFDEIAQQISASHEVLGSQPDDMLVVLVAE